jgi:hypothetical protein
MHPSLLNQELISLYYSIRPKNPPKYVSKIGLGKHELSHFFQKVAIFLADTVVFDLLLTIFFG